MTRNAYEVSAFTLEAANGELDAGFPAPGMVRGEGLNPHRHEEMLHN